MMMTVNVPFSLLCFAYLSVVSATASAAASESASQPPPPPPQEFYFACSGGKLDIVRDYLTQHPEWVDQPTPEGETCLHLTGIYGYSDVTQYLLHDAHANPNIRSTYNQGLRMHPLSWNVYGGHYDNIRLLLQYGADPNLDFDRPSSDGTTVPVTALDIAISLTENEQGDDRFTRIENLLRQNGAKTMNELNEQTEKQQQQQKEKKPSQQSDQSNDSDDEL